MTVYCYKVGGQKTVIIKCAKMVSAVETSRTYGQVVKELQLEDKYPAAVSCTDKLLTVSVVCDDGSMYTSYDVCELECD